MFNKKKIRKLESEISRLRESIEILPSLIEQKIEHKLEFGKKYWVRRSTLKNRVHFSEGISEHYAVHGWEEAAFTKKGWVMLDSEGTCDSVHEIGPEVKKNRPKD